MQRKSKHSEISDSGKSSEYPVVKRGYLDTKKQSSNTEIQEEINNLTEPFKCPVVEHGYWDTIDQSENTETQEEKKHTAYNYKIMLSAFAVSVLAIIVFRESIPGAFGLFFILIIFLAMLFYRTNNR